MAYTGLLRGLFSLSFIICQHLLCDPLKQQPPLVFERASFLWPSPPWNLVFSCKSSSIPAVAVGCFWMVFIWRLERMPATCQDTGTVLSVCAPATTRASTLADLFQMFLSSASDICIDGVCFPCLFSPFQSGAGKPAAVFVRGCTTPCRCRVGVGRFKTAYFVVFS